MLTVAQLGHCGTINDHEELSAVTKQNTLLAWYRKLIANKFDGSKFRNSRGRPRVGEETERLVVRMAKENPVCRRIGKSSTLQRVNRLFGNEFVSQSPLRSATEDCNNEQKPGELEFRNWALRYTPEFVYDKSEPNLPINVEWP